MQTINSFLQKVFQMVKTLATKVTKRMYRQAAVFITGVAVMTVIMLTSNQFGAGGKNALTAFADTKIHETDEDTDEVAFDAELKVQEEIGEESPPQKQTADGEESPPQKQAADGGSDTVRQGQVIVGEQLEKMLLSNKAVSNNHTFESGQNGNETKTNIPINAEGVKLDTLTVEPAKQVVDPYYGLSEQDYDVLLHIVQAEAGICDDKGKILVANVILNRVDSPQFPNNVTDVVYQKSQFSPVSDGAINQVTVTDQTIDCVNRALQGEDHSQGALYFMNRSGSYSHAVRWFDGKLTFLFQHERHEFFK